MIDSIGSSSGNSSTLRSQSLVETSRLRNTEVLTAIQQAPQRASGATAPVTVFSVTQVDRGDAMGTSTAKLPRGSLVDILA